MGVGSEYDSRTSLLSSYPGSVTFFLTFFFLFIISFFAHELFMWPIYRPVACNELRTPSPGTRVRTYVYSTFRVYAMGILQRFSELAGSTEDAELVELCHAGGEGYGSHGTRGAMLASISRLSPSKRTNCSVTFDPP